jgi:hypothetical protein
MFGRQGRQLPHIRGPSVFLPVLEVMNYPRLYGASACEKDGGQEIIVST